MNENYSQLPEPRINYWKTLDGRYILYKDLEDSHLINICRMLNQKGYFVEEHPFLYPELVKRNLDYNKFYLKVWLNNIWFKIKSKLKFIKGVMKWKT